MDGKSPEAHIADLNAALRDFSEKFTRDLEEAQKIQISTLPREVPKGENFEIAYSYQPLEELGGDWFYLHNENDGSISIVIADVTGHGLAAALIGGWIKLAFWATADITDPASRLNLLNSLITPQLPDGRFITISFINYHPVSQVLKQARGGHPPTLIYKSATDQTGELMGHGFALGFMEDGEYELIESTLESGDTVVLCTDGIVEAQNMNSQFYGTAGIIKTLSRIKPLTSADETKNMILEDLNSFTNGRIIKDDVTLIVLKCLH
jgi:sigma-B regulation protein RsbU (phosphoserine phosphatase)